MAETESHRLLLAIVTLGLVVRLLYVLGYPQQPVMRDEEGYDKTAMALVSTGAYQMSGRVPLYPTFLAAIYVTVGHSYPAVRAAQAVIVALTALVAFFLARAVFAGRYGLVAAGLVSFHPGFIAYSGLLLTETVLGLLLALFVWCAVQAHGRGGFGWAVSSGVTLGLAALCRFEIVGILVPVAAWLAWRRRSVRGLQESLLFLVVATLAVAPWSVRQYASRDQNVALNGGMGATVWLSTYPGDWLEWYPDREPLRSLMDCNCSARELDRRLMQAAVRNLIDFPGRYAQMSAKRFARFWIGSHSYVVRGLEPSFGQAIGDRDVAVVAVKGLLLILNVGLLGLAAVGSYTERATWEAWFPLILVIAFINSVHVLLFSTSRYQIPIMPLVLVLAAPAVYHLVVGRQARKVT